MYHLFPNVLLDPIWVYHMDVITFVGLSNHHSRVQEKSRYSKADIYKMALVSPTFNKTNLLRMVALEKPFVADKSILISPKH